MTWKRLSEWNEYLASSKIQESFPDLIPFSAKIEILKPPDCISSLRPEIHLMRIAELICALLIRLAHLTSRKNEASYSKKFNQKLDLWGLYSAYAIVLKLFIHVSKGELMTKSL